LEGLTVGAIIWTLCDVLGFSNYLYVPKADDPGTVIPYFWTDGKDTLWEVIRELAEDTQTAIYFDEYDILQIKSNKAAFDLSRPVDWAFQAIDDSRLADIVELNSTDAVDANDVTITFSPTQPSQFNNGFPKMEAVWKPEADTVFLRSTPLRLDLQTNSPSFFIKQDEARTWPFESLVNIRGEIIKYRGKVYKYYTGYSSIGSTIVHSEDGRKAVDQNLSDPLYSYQNYFSGEMMIETRGVFKSGVRSHNDLPSKSVRRNIRKRRLHWSAT
jgi:hypothetical protein